LSSVENILNVAVSPKDEFNLLVMLHAHVIASVEQYISSTFIHHVTNSDALTRKLIESDPEFGNRKFTLDKIYLKQEELKVTVASYLKSLNYGDSLLNTLISEWLLLAGGCRSLQGDLRAS